MIGDHGDERQDQRVFGEALAVVVVVGWMG